MVQTVLKSENSPKSTPSDKTSSHKKCETINSSSPASISFRLSSILFWAVVLLSLAILVPDQLYDSSASTPLNSEEYGIYHAFNNGLIWGKDITSLHGPLAILTLNLKTSELGFLNILFHIFVFANLGWLLISSAKRLSRMWQVCSLPLLAFGLSSGAFGKELPTTLLTLTLFHLFSCHKQSKGIATSSRFFLAGVCASLAFYINLPTGYIALLCLAIYGTHVWVYEDRPAFFQLAVLGVGGLHLFLNLTLPIHLGSVLFQSKEIIQGYNDSLFVPVGMTSWSLWLAGCSSLLVAGALLVSLPDIFRDDKAFLHTTITGIIMFALFKQSFIRGEQDTQLYFHFLPTILGLLFLNSSGRLRQMSGKAVFIALTISTIYMRPGVGFSSIDTDIVATGSQPLLHDASEFTTPANNQHRLPSPIPKELLDIVGTHSLDIYPWGLQHIAQNQLTPSIRPTIHAELATTARLELLNYRHYLSPNAPEFLLLHLECLENHYCFGEESLTKWAIFRNYAVVQNTNSANFSLVTANKFILLRRKKITSEQTIERVTLGEGHLGDWMSVPQEQREYLYLKASTRYTLTGKLLAQLFKPVELRLKIQLTNGETYDYRITRQNLVTGIPIGVFVDSIEDAALFLSHQRGELPTIKSFMLYSPSSLGFDNNYTLAFETWVPKETIQ